MLRNILYFTLIVLVAIALALMLWSSSYGYDTTKPEVDPIHNGNFTYVRIQVIGIAEGMYYDMAKGGWKTKETLFSQRGSGCVVREGFVLTAAHVLVPDTVSTIMDKYAVHITKPLKVISTNYLIYHFSNNPVIAKLHYIDEKLDIAILKYEPSGILEPITYPIEYAQGMLEQGDLVFSFVHKRDENGRMQDDVELRYGHILSPLPTMPQMGSELAWLNPYDMTLLMSIQGGDSGSPLFAFRDGEPILVGILRAIREDEITSLAYAVSLPSIRRYLNIGN